MSIQDCEELIEVNLVQEFSIIGNNEITLVENNFDRILSGTKVDLWAQSLTGNTVRVNMLLPRIRAFLLGLAKLGVGYTDDHDEVRYEFRLGRLLFVNRLN